MWLQIHKLMLFSEGSAKNRALFQLWLNEKKYIYSKYDTTETEENFDLRELIFNLKMFSFSYRVQYIYSNDCHRTAKGRNLQPWQSTQTCPTCLNFKHFRSLGEFNIKPQKFMYLSINKLVCGRFHDIKRDIYIIHSSISAVFFLSKNPPCDYIGCSAL